MIQQFGSHRSHICHVQNPQEVYRVNDIWHRTNVFTSLPRLLMDEILHHPGCKNPVTNGIFTISTGAGFLPSTVFRQILPIHPFISSICNPARLPSARSSARTTPTREPSSHGSPRQGGQLTFLIPKPWSCCLNILWCNGIR